MIQLTIALDTSFVVSFDDEVVETDSIIINSNVNHCFSGREQHQLFLLIDPTSLFGELLVKQYLDKGNFVCLPSEVVLGVRAYIKTQAYSWTSASEYRQFIDYLYQLLQLPQMNYKDIHPVISQVIQLLSNTQTNELTIDSLAKQVSLSPSRLSHLFKEQTGLSLYSFITMNRVRRVIDQVFSGVTITEASVDQGFDSPSHFASVCKKMFGMSVRSFSKDSVYLKVSSFNP